MTDTAITPERRQLTTNYTLVDRVFRGSMTAGALFSLVVLALIAAFLLYRGFEIFSDFGFSFITGEIWNIGDPMDTSTAVLGIGAMLVGSVLTAFIAILIAVPFAIATALFIEYYAPKSVRTALTALLDLVAAIPSVIFGIWGYAVLLPIVEDWSVPLERWLDFIPVFDVPSGIFGRSPFLAGLLLALMITPIVNDAGEPRCWDSDSVCGLYSYETMRRSTATSLNDCTKMMEPPRFSSSWLKKRRLKPSLVLLAANASDDVLAAWAAF